MRPLCLFLTLVTVGSGPVAYAAHWDNRHFVLENNIYDLYATDNNTAIVPRGASMFGLLETDIPPYIFPNFVYRGNVIRHIDLRIPVGLTVPSYGIYATTIGNGIVEQNIIDVSADHPLNYPLRGNLTHLQNTTNVGLKWTPIVGPVLVGIKLWSGV